MFEKSSLALPPQEVAWKNLRSPIRACLFDLDGTLIESESQTGESIQDVMRGYGVEGASLPSTLTRGCSWRSICLSLQKAYPAVELDLVRLEADLIRRWGELVHQGVQPLPGAIEAFRAAAEVGGVAVVSSSPQALVEHLLASVGLARYVPLSLQIGAERVSRSKPDPEGFLMAASKLGVPPEECLIFEDSEAGLRAARATGGQSIAILYSTDTPDLCRSLADLSIRDYRDLPPHFWKAIARGSTLELP